VVELFAASRLTRSPGWYTPDWPVARLSAPHVSQVERTQSGPDPLDRIWPSIRRCRPSPALNRDGLGQNLGRGISASPTLRNDKHPYRIECRDYSSGLRFWTYKASLRRQLKVYSGQASVELGERLSTHPALRADHMTGG